MIYLDHNATTAPLPEVIEEVARVSQQAPGNPGSRHAFGRRARQALEAARQDIADVLNADPSEVIFTSGGTESINTALFGLAGTAPGLIATQDGEHPATVEAVKRLERQGFSRVKLGVDRAGLIQPDTLEQVLKQEHLKLISILLAHNETGVIQDLAGIASLCESKGIPWHVDAVQAAGKIALDFTSTGATAMSLASHKCHGPRGIGVLLLRRGTKLRPLIVGGHQEQGLRAGTECVALAAGMALALKIWQQQYEERTRHIEFLRNRLQSGLMERCAPALVHGDQSSRLPNTLSIAFPGCDGESLLVALDLAGICCSMGSACASGSAMVSPILLAMNVPEECHRTTFRLSVGFANTVEEIDEAIETIARLVTENRRRKEGSFVKEKV